MMLSRTMLIFLFGGILFLSAGSLAAQNRIPGIIPELSMAKPLEGDTFEVVYRFSRFDDARPISRIDDLSPRLALLGPGEVLVDKPALNGNPGTIKIVFRFRALESGWCLLSAIQFSFPDNELVSDPVLIGIGRKDSGVIPPDLTWSFPQSGWYAGQSALVTLELRMAKSISLVQGIDAFNIQGAIVEEVAGLGSMQVEKVSDLEFYRIPVASWLVTPTSTGALVLPAVKVRFDAFSRTALSRSALVVPLPENVPKDAAIGSFFLFLLADSEEKLQDQPFTIVVRLEGTGNVPYVRIPELIAPGLAILSREEHARLLPYAGGYRGTREIVYKVVSQQAGDMVVSLPGLSTFDPATGRSAYLPQRSLPLQIRFGVQEYQNPRVSTIKALDRNLKQEFNHTDKPEIFLIVLCILVPLVVLVWPIGTRRRLGKIRLGLVLALVLIVALFVGELAKRKQIEQDAQGLMTAFLGDLEAERYTMALENGKQLVKLLPDNALVWYGLSLSALRSSDDVLAIAALDQAYQLHPSSPVIQESLGKLEALMKISVPFRAFMTLPASLLLPVASVLFIVGIILYRLPLPWSGMRTAGAMFACMLAGVCALLFVMESIQAGVEYSFVKHQALVVRKIPDDTAQPWIVLPKGTKLKTYTEIDGFVQVETAFAVKGWVKKTELAKRSIAHPPLLQD